jgi:DNA anti-recombination protein RmuC
MPRPSAATIRRVQTHLNMAAHHLEQAAEEMGRAEGLTRKAGTVERLARETTATLTDLPTPAEASR